MVDGWTGNGHPRCEKLTLKQSSGTEMHSSNRNFILTAP